MHSFDASTLNFGEVVLHISPLNNHYWHFLIQPSGPTSGANRCWRKPNFEFFGLTPNAGPTQTHTGCHLTPYDFLAHVDHVFFEETFVVF